MKSKFTVLAIYSSGWKELVFPAGTTMEYGEAEDEIPFLKAQYKKRINDGFDVEMPTFQIISTDEAGDYR